MFRALIVTCALTLVACGEDSTPVDYVDDPQDPAPSAPARSDCPEGDFAGAPLEGPGFADGVYVGPTDAPLVASSTVLYLLGPEVAPQFQSLMVDISAALMQSEGLLGLALGGSETCGSARTLALWRDRASMMAFVGSEAHYRAMQATPELADHGTRTVHWTFDPATETLDWAVGIERASGAAAIEGLGGQ